MSANISFRDNLKWPELMARLTKLAQAVPNGIADFGGKISEQKKMATGSLAAGATYRVAVNLEDVAGAFPGGVSFITPRSLLYVDTDADATALYLGDASALSAGQNNLRRTITVAATPHAGSGNVVATLELELRNDDSVAHSYYWYVDAYYMQTPQSGVVR